MKLLHIDSSVTGRDSASRRLSAAVVQELKAAIPDLEVAARDLVTEPLPHLDAASLAVIRPAPGAEPTDDENTAALQQFLDADIVVIGAPMYNFTIPSQLKAWLDRILVGGKTFRYTPEGPVGLAGGKTVIIASSRGNLYGKGAPAAPMDFQETYLRAVFGFMGVTDVQFLRAEGLAFSPDHFKAGVDAALAAAPALAVQFAQAKAA